MPSQVYVALPAAWPSESNTRPARLSAVRAHKPLSDASSAILWPRSENQDVPSRASFCRATHRDFLGSGNPGPGDFTQVLHRWYTQPAVPGERDLEHRAPAAAI